MKRVKEIILAVFLIGTLVSCMEVSYNRKQYQNTLKAFTCYEKINFELIDNENRWAEVVNIRESKNKGDSDPVTVKEKFRLIEEDEITEILSEEWIKTCKPNLDSINSFRGIRVPNKGTVIIEINKFERGTYMKDLSKSRLIEIHRLIRKVDKANHIDYNDFSFGTESIIHKEELNEEWTYLITQFKII